MPLSTLPEACFLSTVPTFLRAVVFLILPLDDPATLPRSPLLFVGCTFGGVELELIGPPLFSTFCTSTLPVPADAVCDPGCGADGLLGNIGQNGFQLVLKSAALGKPIGKNPHAQ
uniref:Uncharacterized protein n=1 Tax=Arundo donax TaxID=35708 RepID=A0A0A9GG01_ARUDO